MTEKKKIQVNISPEAVKEIEDLRKRLNLGSISDVIRSSLKLTRYLELEKEAGNEVIIRHKKSNKEKEVVFGSSLFG
jgi:Arc/MetJ-type ribon-helix-helix transcriptional regulator